jgi:hypothetical protein
LFIQQLLHQQPTDNLLQMKGAGLFKAAATHKPTLQHLQTLIKTRYGTDFLSNRLVQLNNAILHLTPSDWSKPLATPVYTLAEHYQDIQTARHAIQLLQQNAIAADTISLNEPLTPADTQRLQHFQQQLHLNILSLLDSNRPDWGYALLINIARLMAVDTSLSTQHWVFIDDFAEDNERVASEHITDLAAQIHFVKQQWSAAQPAADFTEMAYSRLEMTANHYAELSKARQNASIRYTGEQALPDKPVPLLIDSVPRLSVAELEHALADINTYETRLHEQLAHHNRYDLVTRNCVTELFRTIDDALLNSPALRLINSADTHLEQALGGHIQADYNFIPWVSFHSVQTQLHVSDSQLLPSYRGLQLEKLANQPLKSLQEISTLTSSSYSFNANDAWFLFFTDDTVLLRPVLGAVNVATAISQSLFGLFSLPFDDGENLHAGAVGLLMSAPELLFINIRKGSYPYLPRSVALSEVSPDKQ